jgi:GNAT superfamily N-acetyltransferase
VEIRRATPEDVDAITDVYLASRDAAPMPAGVHPRDEVRDHTRRVLPDRDAFLAIDDGQPVGVLLLEGDSLNWLFIHPGAQGRGVGSALLDHAKTLRPGGLALWVFEMNTPAQRFYEERGFIAVRRTDGDNEEGAPDIRYVWGEHPEAP